LKEQRPFVNKRPKSVNKPAKNGSFIHQDLTIFAIYACLLNVHDALSLDEVMTIPFWAPVDQRKFYRSRDSIRQRWDSSSNLPP
jgi:hypothetical protein